MRPGIVVVGSKRVKDLDPSSPTFGREGWEPGKVVDHVMHWTSGSAKKRCGGDFSQARPGDVVAVEVYRGLDARMANEIRADHRRLKDGKKIFGRNKGKK